MIKVADQERKNSTFSAGVIDIHDQNRLVRSKAEQRGTTLHTDTPRSTNRKHRSPSKDDSLRLNRRLHSGTQSNFLKREVESNRGHTVGNVSSNRGKHSDISAWVIPDWISSN